MQQFRAAILRVTVLIALYAMTAQTILAQTCAASHTAGQTAICGQNGAGDNSPAGDGACCVFSCCLIAAAGWTAPPPIMVHAPLRVIMSVAWAWAGINLTHARMTVHAYATGPPFLLTRITI